MKTCRQTSMYMWLFAFGTQLMIWQPLRLVVNMINGQYLFVDINGVPDRKNVIVGGKANLYFALF